MTECFSLTMQSTVESLIGTKLDTATIRLSHGKPEYYLAYADYMHSDPTVDHSHSMFMILVEPAEAQDAERAANVSIESIALTQGYDNAAAFRQAFKRWHGVSPSGYRQSQLGATALES